MTQKLQTIFPVSNREEKSMKQFRKLTHIRTQTSNIKRKYLQNHLHIISQTIQRINEMLSGSRT